MGAAERRVREVIGALVAGTFLAILFIAILVLAFVIKSLSVKCLDEAYRMYLLENGYKQPKKEVIEEYYRQASKNIRK